MTTSDDAPPTPADDAVRDRLADSDLAAKPPAMPDAERLESALREGGPLVHDDPEREQARRAQPTEDGPGTSLT
ncbi:hypothetical protein [Motilibacter aurantiacus]|uniref:hypothetical protein n=1 Tax=Motilibacter aurantiacus TaxID=2714955 RepID=UPI00140DFA7F|nr:hypothetical protein [Motilibacter aurantiacus]NHC46226.1 hypothetical protein [Motilibacter aurantiacus]